MSLFALQAVRKSLGMKVILQEASFSIDASDKVGLIGTNGSGKSTLLKMIAGLETLDGGQLLINHGAKIVYLPQQPDLDPQRTCRSCRHAERSPADPRGRREPRAASEHRGGEAGAAPDRCDGLGGWRDRPARQHLAGPATTLCTSQLA